MKYKRLILTEKNSQAKALNQVIKGHKVGINYVAEDTIIAPLQGHLLINKSPKWYAEKYDRFSEASIQDFPNKLELIPNPNTKEKYNNAISVIKESEEIIIATDFDNEGAAIALNIIEKAGAKDRISFMLEMGSLNESELKKSLENPIGIPYETMAESARARAWIDFAEGMYLSTALSKFLGNNYTLKINYGGVKTPLTYIVVERESAYNSHKKTYFYTVEMSVKACDQEFKITLNYKNSEGKITDRFNSESEAKEAAEKFKSSDIFIESITRTNSSTIPPKLFELTGLQAEMSKKYSYSPSDTMSYAQSLYDTPLTIQSYPRTDTPYLKSSEYEDVSVILDNLNSAGLLEDSIYHEIISNDIPKRNSVFKDSEVIAHGAIIPTTKKEINFESLKSTEQNVFKSVALRYAANFMQDYKYIKVKGKTNTTDGGIFGVFSENIPVSCGWKKLLENCNEETINNYKKIIPEDLKVKDNLEIIDFNIHKGETKPKPLFTMASLLNAMENIASLFPENEKIKQHLGEHGIGTPATRSKIISEIMDKEKNGGNPPLIEKNKKIVSSDIAKNIISYLPIELISPIKRAELTAKLKKIAKGELSYDSLISEYKEELLKNINIVKNIVDTKGIIPAAKNSKNDRIPLGKCPLCDGNIVEAKKAFICSNAKYKKDESGKITNDGCKYFINKASLSRFGKNNISVKEIRNLLKNKKEIVSLVSQKGKSYNATMVINEKYGVSIDFGDFKKTKS